MTPERLVLIRRLARLNRLRTEGAIDMATWLLWAAWAIRHARSAG